MEVKHVGKMEVTKKSSKVRFSKNKKKGWKKHCNIDDVDEFLEDKRLEERSGGPVSEKPNDEIFFIDKDKEFKVKIPNKKKDILDDLKCFSALKNPSKVLPPIHVNVIQPSSKKRNKISKNKNRLLKKQSKQAKVLHSEIKKENDDVYDIWSSKENNSSVEKELDKDLIYYINETTKKRPPKVPNHRYQKPSLLPAVEVPPPGTSYNPEYIDHIKLLSEVVKNELEYEKDHRKIEKALTEKFPTIDEAPTEKTWLEEMSQGLKTENTGDDDEENDEVGAISCNPPVRFDDKKSKQKRRREKEMKEKLKEKKKRKLENKRINEIYRLRSIKKDIFNLEKKVEDKQMKKDERLIKRMYRPHTLSKYKYEAPDLEFNLGEELTGELRTIKVVGNILEDRYKSFQRRNIIEPRIRQKVKRKYKLKVFERK